MLVCLPFRASSKNKKLMNPGFPAAHPEPAYRCFLPDLTGFTGPWLRRTRAHERYISCWDAGEPVLLILLKMAERVGFEPTLGFPKHAFQACAFGRSATSPVQPLNIHRTLFKNHPPSRRQDRMFRRANITFLFPWNFLYGGEGGI